MRAFKPMLLFFAMAGCGVIDPTLINGPVSEGITPGELLNAAVVTLQEQGYTVIVADREGGVVTTDWRDESSAVDRILLGEFHRTRVSVTVDFYTRNVAVQMTRQIKEGDSPWRNEGLSNGDRTRIQNILSRIQSRARAVHEGQAR